MVTSCSLFQIPDDFQKPETVSLPAITISTMTPIPTPTFQPTITSSSIWIESGLQGTIPAPIETENHAGLVSPTFPQEYHITDIVGRSQYFALGCEASAAVDWAAYYGISINEFEFQHQLPLSDNPDKGFVGNVDSPWGQVPPYAYGVHAGPIAELLQEFGLNAVSVKGYTVSQIKEQISNDNPVIAWVIGNVVGGVPFEYIDSSGDTTIVAAYEHVVLVTGYGEDTIRYMNNGGFYDIPTQVFANSWEVLGKMAIISE